MSASSSTGNASRAARNLADLSASIEVSENWIDVELAAQKLANELRVRDSLNDEHTALGKTLLPQTLTTLLKAAVDGPKVPDSARTPAVFELLRVGANLCMDHNENRGHLLEAGFPQAVVSLLEAYADALPPVPQPQPFPLSIPNLKIVKTAIGAVLNSSLQFEPVQSRLISLEAAITLLKLSISIYPPRSWIEVDSVNTDAELFEEWGLRKTISDWSWRAIASLKDNRAEQPLFGPESIPALVSPLRSFIPPYLSPKGPLFVDSQLRHQLLSSDIDVLAEVCELLEASTMDKDEVRLSLARGVTSKDEHNGQEYLTQMLDFVELGDYPTYWNQESFSDKEQWKKVLDLCKTAVIKSVVEVAGDEKNIDVLWDVPSPTGFVNRMIKWLRDSRDAQPSETRDDLVICSSLSLGNLARKENNSLTLVKEPVSITPILVAYLTPQVDYKVKHGVIGLLKHLAQTPANRQIFGAAGVIERLRTCQIFNETADVAEIVQMSAINLTKHLCTNNVSNAITSVLDFDNDQKKSSCLNQIIALSRRSDTISVKSEGARVLVNVIKSLCSSSGSTDDPKRNRAIQLVTSYESATTLTRLLGRSKKHVVLLNEAIIALLLLAHLPKGAVFVLDALLATLPREVLPPSRSNSLNFHGSQPASPVVAIGTALDMIVTILTNAEKNFAPELRANACALLGEVGKESLKAEEGGRIVEVERLRSVTKPLLLATQNSPDSLALSSAARRALESWS